MSSEGPGRRRNIWLPDAMWSAVLEAAAREMLDTGERVTSAEFIRRAIAERLQSSGGATG